MNPIRTSTKLDDRGRQSLRLDPEVWTAIDMARLRRAGSISRNTWITEAIAEKLAREQDTGRPRRQAWCRFTLKPETEADSGKKWH